MPPPLLPSAKAARLRRRIAAQLPVVALDGPLGLRFHAAGPGSGLRRLAQSGGGGAPYWGHLWPGGAALVAHLQAFPEMVRGRSVLDLGAGSGLVGIAAARAGARRVLASESDPVARLAVGVNAALNGVELTVLGDMLDAPDPEVDLILVGDMFYAPDLAQRVLAFLLRAKRAEVLVGDIGRADLPLGRFQDLARYPVREVGEAAALPRHSGRVLRLAG